MKIRFLLVFLIMFAIKNSLIANESMNLYDFSFEDIDGNNVNLNKFTGKPILIVNTASRCGFTPQYANLQNLFLPMFSTCVVSKRCKFRSNTDSENPKSQSRKMSMLHA